MLKRRMKIYRKNKKKQLSINKKRKVQQRTRLRISNKNMIRKMLIWKIKWRIWKQLLVICKMITSIWANKMKKNKRSLINWKHKRKNKQIILPRIQNIRKENRMKSQVCKEKCQVYKFLSKILMKMNSLKKKKSI